MTLLVRLRQSWMHFWFQPAAALELGVSRALFFGGLAIFYMFQDLSAWADVSTVFWQPIWLFDRFQLPRFPEPVLHSLEVVWNISLFTAAFGIFTRTSMAIVAVLGTYLLGLPHNYGQTYHFDALLVLAFWILTFSRAGDAFSIDSLRRTAAGLPPPDDDPEYRWPTQLTRVALALVFFAAGVAKIWTSGLEWVMSDHMALLLHRVHYNISDADPPLMWGSAIAAYPVLARGLAAITLLVETLYPVALFSRRLRAPMVVAGIVLIVGIRLLMGPTFEHFLLINLFWVPWTAVGARAAARMPRRHDVHVFYDGSCGFCLPTIRVLQRLDLLERVTFLDVIGDWERAVARFPALDRQQCLTDMHAVTADGRVFKGFEAYRALTRVLPLTWLVLPLLYLPPTPQIGKRIYRRIADNRHATTCPVPALTAPSASDSR